MLLIYIAGKYRGKTSWQVEQNIRAAEIVGFDLASKYNIVPIIPHTMYRHFDGELTDDFWLKGTLELMRRCDAAVFIPGWHLSSGAVGEHKEAQRIGMPTFDLETGPLTFEVWLNEVRGVY